MSKKTALVTGGAGFVGSHIADYLKNEGWNVVVADNLSTGKESNISDDIDLELIDLTTGDINKLTKLIKPNSIFHTAAQVSVSKSTKLPSFDAEQNIIATIKILEALSMAGKGNESFLFISTGGAIYGNTKTIPANESLIPKPESPYAISKFSSENYIKYFRKNHKIKTSIVRPANIYGPRQDPNGEAGVIAIFINAMLNNKNINIFGDGENIRDYIYITDIVKGCILASELYLPYPINLGTEKGTSVLEIFNTLSKYCKYKLNPVFLDKRPGDIDKIILDINKAKNLLKWSPDIILEDGFKKTIDWFAKNN